MLNIGVVVYTRDSQMGTLKADWCHSSYGPGTGIATGGSGNGFEGDYIIKYYDNKGALQAIRDLEIKKESETYSLTWFHNKKITCKGIGIETKEGLCVGFCDI